LREEAGKRSSALAAWHCSGCTYHAISSSPSRHQLLNPGNQSRIPLKSSPARGLLGFSFHRALWAGIA